MGTMAVEQTHRVQSLLRLTRMGINGLVAPAVLAGYFLKAGHWTMAAVAVTIGCLLLASGCSALNQVQEADRDKLMSRTQSRPIAAGILSSRAGAFLASAFFIAAALFLSVPSQPVLYLLMAAAILLYNGIYTPMKTITPFALLIGAVMGTFPLLFGWVAAGGSVWDREIIILAVVFYLWQTPHFWLLVNRYRGDYRKAGFPQVFQTMPETRYQFLVFLWIAAYLVSILLIPLFLPLYAISRHIFSGLPAAVLVLIVLWRHNTRILFPLLTASIVLVMILLVVDKAM